ncbi:hypothetical protein Tco_1403225 [Tanacetum coccineum]
MPQYSVLIIPWIWGILPILIRHTALLPRDQRHPFLRMVEEVINVDAVEEMGSVGFGIYWAESVRQISDKGDLSRRYTLVRKHGAMISKGHFVARLVEHFGLLTEQRLQGLTVIDQRGSRMLRLELPRMLQVPLLSMREAVSAPVQAPQPPSRLPQLLGLCPKDG